MLQGALALGGEAAPGADEAGEGKEGGGVPASAAPTVPSAQFGDYALLEEVGRGGMGVVYKARQLSLDRMVALKTILFGPLATPEQIRRFRTEASAAAALQHPNIVAVHEVGVHQNQHYLVMDLVDGPNLGRLVRDKPLPAKQAATYLKAVAEAIHFAHERGILHRDLKPSNVLVGSDDRPRVADFGLARRLGTDSSLTLTGQMLGSPNYMPPEQAARGSGKVGRPADVYGLGAILYHVLTARPPFQAATVAETLQLVTGAEPLSPRVLVPSVPRDLETICLKCLEKDPSKRYPTAEALAAELDRYLKGEPIQARRTGLAGKAWRWCRRKPAIAAAVTVCVAVFAVGFTGVAWQWRRAEAARLQQQALAYDSDMRVAFNALEAGDLVGAKVLLDRWLPQKGEPDLRGFEWRLAAWQALGHEDSELALDANGPLALSPDGQILAVAAPSKVSLLRLSSTQLVAEIATPFPAITCLAFSADGTLLGVGSDRTARSFGSGGRVEVWKWKTHELVGALPARSPQVAFSPSAKILVIAEAMGFERPILVWDFSRPGAPPRELSQPGSFVAFSPDGSRLFAVLAGNDLAVAFWNPVSWEPMRIVAFPPTTVYSLGVSRDGKWAATGHLFGEIFLWDLTSCSSVWTQKVSNATVTGVAFSPDSQQLAASAGGTVAFLSVTDTHAPIIRHSADRLQAIQYLSDGKSVVTSTSTGSRPLFLSPVGASSANQLDGVLEPPVFSPDDLRVAVRTTNQQCLVLELRTLQTVRRIPVDLIPVAFAPEGRTLLGLSVPPHAEPIELQYWDIESGQRTRSLVLEGSTALTVDGNLNGLPRSTYRRPVSGDLQYLAIGSHHRTWLWSVSTGRLIRSWEMEWAAGFHAGVTSTLRFSPDSRLLASVCEEGTVALWSVPDGKLVRSFVNGEGTAIDCAFTADGLRLAVSGEDGSIRIYDLATVRQLAELRGHSAGPNGIRGIAFAPDGRRLVSGGADQTIRIWDLSTGRETAVLNQEWLISRVWFFSGGIAAWWRLPAKMRFWIVPTLEELDQARTSRVRQVRPLSSRDETTGAREDQRAAR